MHGPRTSLLSLRDAYRLIDQHAWYAQRIRCYLESLSGAKHIHSCSHWCYHLKWQEQLWTRTIQEQKRPDVRGDILPAHNFRPLRLDLD